MSQSSFTYKLDSMQQGILADIINNGNYRPIVMEHTIAAGKTPDCSIAVYKSGKCLIQGKGAADFISFVLEPLVLQDVGLGYEELLNPEAFDPHMGIDESGKGDFFGPIVIASAYVDKALIDEMKDMDVKDSKSITSDKKAINLGRALRKLLGNRYSLVKIGPQAYNRLYHKMRNLNTLLAWGHARAIENLLEAVPTCPKAISDQFGKEEQVKKALMKKGKSIELIQKHKAESDIAVAAASIIAREGFLTALQTMSMKYDIEFPKGASAKVKEQAVELCKRTKPEILLETAKCHFKTTDEVLGKMDTDRSILGPEGSATSKATRFKK